MNARNLLVCALLAGPAAAALAAGSATSIDVDQAGSRFSQPAVTLEAGGQLNFHNSDDVTHNIMLVDSEDETYDKGMQKPGEVIRVKLDQPGTYQVRCSIHPKMKMNVSVTAKK